MYINNIIKPTHRCNFACKYCYNEDERHPIMTRYILEKVIKETFNYIKNLPGDPEVEFIWHGGEPLIVGIDFYNDAVKWQRCYGKGIRYKNAIQTNGTLLNIKWINFLKENDFSISISLDGPKNIHDLTRIYHNGKGTFEDVMKAIDLIREAGIKFGVPIVISQLNKDKVGEIYDFLASEKIDFHIIPLTKLGGGLTNYADLGLAPHEYAKPWIEMFDKWFYANEDHYVLCKEFVNKAVIMTTGRCIDCVSMEQCANNNISIDPEGFVYPCATFSAKTKWRYGNINDYSLTDLMNRPIAIEVRNRKIDTMCQSCRWQS